MSHPLAGDIHGIPCVVSLRLRQWMSVMLQKATQAKGLRLLSDASGLQVTLVARPRSRSAKTSGLMLWRVGGLIVLCCPVAVDRGGGWV